MSYRRSIASIYLALMLSLLLAGCGGGESGSSESDTGQNTESPDGPGDGSNNDSTDDTDDGSNNDSTDDTDDGGGDEVGEPPNDGGNEQSTPSLLLGSKKWGIRMVRRMIVAISLGVCFNAQADVPYQFSNGEVADANEVNANFNYLDERLDSLASDQDQAHEKPEPTHEYSRNPIDTTPGERFTIAGEEYTSTEVPFVDPSSGKRYTLLIPLRSPEFRVSVTHTTDPIGGQFSIDGYSASIGAFADRWTYRASSSGDNTPYWEVEYWERTDLSIQVGDVQVFTSIDLPGTTVTRNTLDKTELSEFQDSYVGVVDWGAVSEHRLDTQAMEAILNRIHIREL